MSHSEDDRLAVRQWLEALEFPPEVAAQLAKKDPAVSWSLLVGLFFIALLGAGFIGAAFTIWPWGEGLTAAVAQRATDQLGGLAYDINFGLSLVLGFFVIVSAANSICYLITLKLPAALFSRLYLQVTADNAAYSFLRRLIRMINRRTPFATVEQYLRDTWRAYGLWWGKWSGVLALAIVGFFLIDISNNRVWTSEGVSSTRFIPGLGRNFRPYSDVERVELACNHTEKRDGVYYEIYFGSGGSARAGSRLQKRDGTWLDALEAIDHSVRQTDAVFERWSHLDRNPVHPRCLRAHFAELNQTDRGRLSRILRLGAFEGDPVID